jgi:hypothetical protein
MAFSIATLCIECHYAKCCYAESRVLFIVMLSVSQLSVVMHLICDFKFVENIFLQKIAI